MRTLFLQNIDLIPRKFLSVWGCVRQGYGADRPDSVQVFCIVKQQREESIIPDSAKDLNYGSIEVRTTSGKHHRTFSVGQEIVALTLSHWRK